MESHLSIHAIISGKVQGVYFRNTTRQKAEELGLTGWVKNLDNGDVELLASGSKDPLMLLTEWLWEGPPRAEVSNVQWTEVAWEKFEGFSID